MLQAASELSSEAVKAALQEILASPAFRSSRQSQVLLRYIVEHSLTGEEHLLRERVIGAAIFNRAPDYDTANDPIVRGRAGDLRKRLAQYYQESLHDHPVMISIPSGSYRAVFSTPTIEPPPVTHIAESAPPDPVPDRPEAEATTPPTNFRSSRLWIAAALCLTVLLIVGLCIQRSRSNVASANQPFLDFWAPIVSSGKPPVIYIGANYAYRLSTPFLKQYQAEHQKEYQGPEFFIDLKPSESIPEKDLIPVHSLIGFGDVAASSRIVSTLTRLGSRYDIRYGQDVAISDMHSAPVVIVGGFSNDWGLEFSRYLRFTLAKGDRILDSQNPTRAWPNLDGTPEDPPSDYVVISRLPRSETGNCLLIVAGIGTVGNQAAADFISDPASLANMLKDAPPGWQHKNMQVILRAGKVREIPTSTEVKATYFW